MGGLILGDCREVIPQHGPYDMLFADPPYGDTSLSWDTIVKGWEKVAAANLKPTGSLWVFGSLRFFMATAPEFKAAGLRLAQDIIWEKNNGTGFAADRFKRVHEMAVQFYLKSAPWSGVYNDVQRGPAPLGVNKTGRYHAARVPHTGEIGAHFYEDDGTRIGRSVQKFASVRGGIHKTAKPVPLLDILVRTSCPPGGLVGDMFAGSGSMGEATFITGRQYVGCEIDPAYHAAASERLAALSPLMVAA